MHTGIGKFKDSGERKEMNFSDESEYEPLLELKKYANWRYREYVLSRQSIACPEQYDLLLNGECIGYLRLRHGRFYATYPDITDQNYKIVYEAYPNGDGIFDDEEREKYLTEAVDAIHNARIESLILERSKTPGER